MNQQLQAWSGEFGNAYLQRNRVEWAKRVAFWEWVMHQTNATSVLEVGCNRGHNLQAIRSLESHGRRLAGVDVNAQALAEAEQACFDVRPCAAQDLAAAFEPASFDLVFTAGVLIHVSPEDLDGVTRAIVRTARAFVLAVEYAAPEEQEIEYRGQKGLLWKRPYGHVYEALGLKTAKFGFLSATEGFDDCCYWLMAKGA